MATETVLVRVEIEQDSAGNEQIVGGFQRVSDGAGQAADSTERLTERVRDNGGAMAVLNTLTGGYAGQARDAWEATEVLGTSFNRAALQARFFGTAARAALTVGGIALLVTLIATLVTHWEDINDFVTGTNRRLEEQLETSKKIAESTKTQLDHYSSIEALLKRGGLSDAEFQKQRLKLAEENATAVFDIYQSTLAKNSEALNNAERKISVARANGHTQETIDRLEANAKALRDENTAAFKSWQLALNARAVILNDRDEIEDEAVGNVRVREESITLSTRDASNKRLLIKEEEVDEEKNLLNISVANHKKAAEKIKSIAQVEADFKEGLVNASINAAATAGNVLQSIAGENEALLAASIIVDAAVGITKIIIATQTANAVVTSAAVASFGVLSPAAAALIAVNNISAGLGIAAITASSGVALSKIGKGGSVSAGAIQSSPTISGVGGEGVLEDTPPPNFAIAGSTDSQLGSTIAAALGRTPIKTFVVASDVTTQQELDRRTVNQAIL